MADSRPSPLLRWVVCPHCWTRFHPEDVLWIAAHADLLGDPRLGPEHHQRILPSRFNMDGNALDAHGFECRQLACRHCHLIIPRALIEMEPMFFSILGTPACGKSYYLAALAWELRRILPGNFSLTFTDVDPLINQPLTASEQALFLNPNAESYQLLTNLVGKTKLQGEMYDTVAFGNQLVSFPRPYLFSFQPRPQHPRHEKSKQMARVLCLYDNAGEHFQPGQDTTAAPVTQHLSRANLLLFLFDPTQDARFQRYLTKEQVPDRGGVRQDQILLEAASRIRRQLALSQNARHDRPLVVVLTKCDAWQHLLAHKAATEPWKGADNVFGLDREQIETRSQEARGLMQRFCPELVQAAEDFSREVFYVPVSTLGHSPRLASAGPAIRPGDIKPFWVTVPVLYYLHRWVRGLIPGIKRPSSHGVPSGSRRSS